MAFLVRLTADAACDLREIHDYISRHYGPGSADHVLDQIEIALSSLVEFPEHASHVKELLQIGILAYREICFEPYRIIYRVTADVVHILVIFDGRRDMRTLLERRLLRVRT